MQLCPRSDSGSPVCTGDAAWPKLGTWAAPPATWATCRHFASASSSLPLPSSGKRGRSWWLSVEKDAPKPLLLVYMSTVCSIGGPGETI